MTQQIHPYNEKALLLAVAQGDDMAYRRLFDNYKDSIQRHALQITDREDIAEELAQEVFMRIWILRERLPDLGKLESWIYTVTRNLSIEYLRRVSRRETLCSSFADLSERGGDNVDEILISKEYTHLLREAVEHLPPQQKRVYILHQQGNLKLEQIAIELGLKRSTVKNHLAEAMRSIRSYGYALVYPVDQI
jgi:RNA polymerase sigma factor (sigma-70 family)